MTIEGRTKLPVKFHFEQSHYFFVIFCSFIS